MADVCKWNVINIRAFCDYFDQYERIYMESSYCPNLIEIYQKCIPIISLEFLDEDNYLEIDENCLLIWEENSHNEISCKKINCIKLYGMLYDDSIKRLQENIVFDERTQIIKEEKFTPELLVKYFDEEKYTVCVVDYDENFLYSLCRQDMRSVFRFSDLPQRRNLFIEDNCDNTKNAAEKFLTIGGVESIPVLRERKVVASMLRRSLRKLVLQWDWIEEKSITKVFDKNVRLLVSSTSDEIQRFMDRFSYLFHIEVFNEQRYQKYLSGKYEALLYSTDIWRNAVVAKYNIKQLYLDCLSDEIWTWFQENNIKYYYFEMPKADEIYQFYRRTVNVPIISGDNIEINGCYFQRDAQKDGFHVYGGRRVTLGEPDNVKNTIYVYGPCIALGSFVVDADTIESQLQCHINDMNLCYRVVNCGGGDSPYEIGNDINSFYMMANTKFKRGDIVIHFGLCAWKNTKMRTIENYYKCAEPFNEKEVLDTKCFSEYSAAHLNALGNRIMERFIFSKIEKSLNEEKRFDEDIVAYGKNKKQIDNGELNKWVMELGKYKTDHQRVGCIVMNCNPFTKGHYRLVEKSRAEVDYLYVFIVEEDKSFFSFAERYEMALTNCRHWDNVKVLPSGKYIISKLTFEEYFNKDSLQEQTIFPAMDIQMFAKYVAPTLDITVRFVGEEKEDMVTAQYNKAMKELLPLDGIEVVEYSRYAIDGEAVSASTVRKCIVDKRWEQLKRYLTKESLQYILLKYNI